jgi:TRAP-type C4-dicarboxylate transport system permease small subunit
MEGSTEEDGMNRVSSWTKFILGLMLIAAVLAMDYAGWRNDTSFISGTMPTGSITSGLFYLATWFTAVVFAPILILAGVIQYVSMRLVTLHSNSGQEGQES